MDGQQYYFESLWISYGILRARKVTTGRSVLVAQLVKRPPG